MSSNTEKKQRHKTILLRIKKDGNVIHIIIGSIAIILIACLLSKYIPQSKTAQENIKQNMIVTKMREIDDIAHQQDKILHDIQSGYNMQRDKLFHKTDNAYHTAQYRDEKFKTAMKLNELIKEQNIFLHDLVGQEKNPFAKAAKEKFDHLQKEIEDLQQK